MAEQPAAVVFDAYGTLLDVHSAMARHAAQLGAEWQTLSQEWRQKQIEYTWVRSLAGPAHHRDFARLTDEALAFVAEKHGIDATLLPELRSAYRDLQAYPEVPAMLEKLREAGIPRAILSNGEPQMLAEGVRAAKLEALLDDVMSVERVGVYKPDPRAYQLAEERFAAPAARIVFVSSNPWDAFGAASHGFRAVWINRTSQPEEYALRGRASELPDLAGLPVFLSK
jgi:2-haloacid dehalogenase